MKILAFFKLIRWKNLLMLTITQLLLKYVLFKNYEITTSLNDIDFILLIISTISIAAGGYIINDIIDRKSDAINKPNNVFVGKYFSVKESILYYLLLSVSGVLAGVHLSFKIGFPVFSIIFVSIAMLLFLYSYSLKRVALLGNLTISFLVGFSILIVGLLDIAPNIGEINFTKQIFILKILIAYALFSTGLNLIREIIKDIEDVDGDYIEHMKTLPILIGRIRARNVTFVITILFALSLIYILILNKNIGEYIVVYGLTLVVLPLLYLIYKMYDAEAKSDYKKLSSLLKIIMVLGILSIFVL